jgi:GNAT superfamily N-acetyltransferase
MALPGDPGTTCQPEGLAIRRVATDEGRRDFLHVTAEAYAVYQHPRALAEDQFVALESVCAPHVQGFVGYAGTAPAAAAAVYLTHGVAGIGWVGVVPAHRGRRYAEAVTWAAVREGFRRGGAFASLQASPMGRPVYERMGFVTPSEYRVLVGAP